MNDTPRWRRLLRMSFTRSHAREQVDDELRYHIETLIERCIGEGLSEDEARRAVMERFESYPTARSALIRRLEKRVIVPGWRRLLDGLGQDVRISCHTCLRRPGFTALAVLTLGLGIGSSTTLFCVINGVLLRPLPYEESSSLVYVGTYRQDPTRLRGITPPEFLALRNTTRTLEGFAASHYMALDVVGGAQPVRLSASAVTDGFFRVLRARPILGRTFAPADHYPGSDKVVVLSHRIWHQQWGGDPGVVGITVTARDNRTEQFSSYTIVGVMPSGFRHPAAIENRYSRLPPTDLWIPLRLEGTPAADRWSSFSLRTVGRLKPGIQLQQTRAEATALATSLAEEHPTHYSGRWHEGRSIGVVSLMERTVADLRGPLVVLLGATALVLVIATANVTGLLLARVLDQTREIAVRSALGAGRGRIVRQIVTETLLLSVLGCGVAVFFAGVGKRAFQLFAPLDFPRLATLSIDPRVVAFAGAVAILAGVLCGAVPALLITRSASDSFLRTGSGVGQRRTTARLRSTLVTVELALAVVLLIGAGLLANSYLRLSKVDPGIDAPGLLLAPIRLNRQSYNSAEKRSQFFLEVTRRLRSVPGVAAASWITDPPMTIGNWSTLVFVDGVETVEDAPQILTHPVGPDYFETMGMPVLSGRGIIQRDGVAGTPVVVV
ncbi:MAG: ABC transporter permease, partial [Gemmatimonadota bacterium]